MILIVVASLAEPPTEPLSFREVTYFSKKHLTMDVLVETEKSMKDLYYEYLRRKGLLDYTDQLVTPEEREEGVRLDVELNYPKTIKLNYIRFDNVRGLLGQIEFLRGL